MCRETTEVIAPNPMRRVRLRIEFVKRYIFVSNLGMKGKREKSLSFQRFLNRNTQQSEFVGVWL